MNLTTDDLSVRVAGSAGELGGAVDEWDRLAVEARLPYGSPGWCLSWWEHVAPETADLRVFLVYDGPQLVAVAPLWATRNRLGIVRYRFLGAGTSARVEPVTHASRRPDAARAIASALAAANPRPDVVELEGTPVDAGWGLLLQQHWPTGGAPRIVHTRSITAPAVDLDTHGEPWLQTKSRNFRQQARRRRRHLVDSGMTFRMVTTPKEINDRLPAFERLHEARLSYRGGSDVLSEDVMRMLYSVAARLDRGDRLRLWTLENDDAVISAHLFLAAGGEVTYWLGGFDDDWGSEQPGLQTLVAAIEHASAVGDTRLDMGPGAQPYKLRLSDHEQQLDWALLFPPGPRRYLAYATTLVPPLSSALRQQLIEALPRSTKDQIKRRLRNRAASTTPTDVA